MSVHSTPPHPSSGRSTASPPQFESSEAYLSLIARVSRTESQLGALSTQVAQLSDLVRSALPNRSGFAPPEPPKRPVFSPFDSDPALEAGGGASNTGFPGHHQPKPSPHIPSATTPSALTNNENPPQDASISALTQQISALSTSVAQLQRLQHTQTQRQPSFPPPTQSVQPQQLGSSSLAGDRHPGPLSLGVPPRHPGGIDTGPLTMPSTQLPLSFGGLSPTRPNMNRSISSSVVQPEFQRHGHSHSHGHGPLGHHAHGQHGSSALARDSMARDWPSPGPGGMQTPGGQGRDGLLTPGGAPGGGIVISKWEHLNLKVDLLRSISKYGIGPPNKIQTRVLPFMIKGSDIIAQAPPTTERIISYVIPALHLCQSLLQPTGPYAGPSVIIITTTVDQAMQCHKLVRGVGGPIGIRAGIAAGASGSSNLQNEIAQMQREQIHLLVGTPAKVNEVMGVRGGLQGDDTRLLIAMDQLIARNLYEHVLNVSKLLPPPRGRGGALTPGGPIPFSPGLTSPYDAGRDSPFNPASKTPFPNANGAQGGASRFGAPGQSPAPPSVSNGGPGGVDRQTCLFSNTIPTDVINFSQSLQVRDPVRVLVRREGGNNSQESVSSVTPGVNLKHTYVYLTITGSAQNGNNAQAEVGPGTIGSGRSQGGPGQMNEEQTRAKEYKLNMLVKMLDDYPLWQAIIHVGSFAILEAVIWKLKSRNWEALYLTPDMSQQQKKAILQQWRLSLSGNGPRFLVVCDVNIKPPEVPWSPLVINFDLPRSVEGYAQRAAAAVPPSGGGGRQGQQGAVNGVIVSFVQAAGGDVEMLRSTECAYRFKSAEIPTVFHDLFQH
ncbi:translation initiation factor [Cryptococcus wingfieldii CBS 7118]|uniref:RNA helicase n=1 Tax=Cryptococcus wingfieldii CBS 7118 TaxID=1295528 RepID=A0A1E3JBU0_9TREE|nr:translation initiation factor [Cryptococcus wingfieldii CBS 7118]ODN98348.1 translation initiation factor [Cryptococcus wingfieldii CBS 7118]